jgi:hypothetical protein
MAAFSAAVRIADAGVGNTDRARLGGNVSYPTVQTRFNAAC